jgi:hypothetical protein
MAVGRGPISRLGELQAPMALVLESLQGQLAELAMYKQMYGPLTPTSAVVTEDDDDDDDDDDDGSDTALEC